MKLTSLFGDALENNDASVRARAVSELPHDDPRLVKLATSDASATVRAAAASRLADMDSLLGIGIKDSDDGVRAAATQRLKALICGSGDDAPELSARLAWLRKSATETLAVHAARHGAEADLRLAALERLEEKDCEQLEDLSADIAISDSSAAVRGAAVQLVRSLAPVERVLAAAKGHDKRVVQIARERLKQLREAEKRLAQREHLCEVMEALARNPEGDANLLVDVSLAARFQVLEKEWHELGEGEGDGAAVVSRFEAAANQVRALVRERERMEADKSSVLAQLEKLHERPGDSDVPAALDDLAKSWRSLQGLSKTETQRFERRLEAVRSSHAAAISDERSRVAIERLLSRYEKRLADGAPLPSGLMKALEKDWGRQKMPGHAALQDALVTRYQAVHDSLRDALKRQKGDSASAAGDLARLLDTLERHIEAGELRQATSLYDKSRARLEKAALDGSRRAAVDKRMHAFAARIADLKRWRHWGTDKARENLCEAAEALVGKKGKIAVLAQDIRRLRDEWKKLDRADGPARQALWQRFNETCEKAYAPCKAHFDEQAARRAANLVARQALCDRLTALVEETDWDAPDWRSLVKTQRDTAREFLGAGPVDRKEKKKIEEAFQRANQRLDEKLAGERERELVRRRGLIRKVAALGAEQDLRTAIASAQQAQKEWSPTVQSERKLEEELWREFRAGCDAVFERRRESFESSKKEASAAEAQRREVCATIAALEKELADLKPEDDKFSVQLNQLSGRFDSAREDWTPVPRGARSKSDARYRDACRAFEKALKQKRSEAKAKEREALISRASLCDSLEQLVLRAHDADRVDALAAQWTAMASVRGPLGKALDGRFETALAAANKDEAAMASLQAALDANLAEKRRLCLELEIALDIDSPAEFADARMAHRIAQLSNALASGGAGDADTPAAVTALADAWYTTGPVPADQHDALSARFQRAMEAAGEAPG